MIPPARQSIDRLLTTSPSPSGTRSSRSSRTGLRGSSRRSRVARCARPPRRRGEAGAVRRCARRRGAAPVDEWRRVRSRRMGDRDHRHPHGRAPPVHRAGRVGLEAADPVLGRRRGIRRRSGGSASPAGQGHGRTRGRASAPDPPRAGRGRSDRRRARRAIGIERTSLHHHLGVLRSAGLVAARAEGVQSWRYTRRSDGITGVATALNRYLDTSG